MIKAGFEYAYNGLVGLFSEETRISPFGKEVFKNSDASKTSILFQSYHGTRLSYFYPRKSFRVSGLFFVVPAWYPNAERLAANWARHQKDSVIVRVASSRIPTKVPVKQDCYMFQEGEELEIIDVHLLSDEWKMRGAKIKEVKEELE